MRQKFTITESEREHIKKLYEQRLSSDSHLVIEPLAHAHISRYTVYVGKSDKSSDEVKVEIKLDTDGNLINIQIDGENYSDDITNDEALELVKRAAEEGRFSKLPTYMAWDTDSNELDSVE